MGLNDLDKNRLDIANFAALKTAIANSEERLVKKILGDISLQALEKSYLIDLAKLNNSLVITKLLEDTPITK
jgi:hypothetical protein